MTNCTTNNFKTPTSWGSCSGSDGQQNIVLMPWMIGRARSLGKKLACRLTPRADFLIAVLLKFITPTILGELPGKTSRTGHLRFFNLLG